MANRQYEAATVFNARIADMRHLWTPSEMYKGQKTQKPNYFAMFLVKKTTAAWHSEPALAGVTQACGKIYQKVPHIVQWPIVDGDMPSPEGKSSEFAKGHWLFSASTGTAPTVEIVQAGGTLAKLSGKIGVKSGDYVMVGVTAAVKQNDPRGVKLYLNAVVFSAPGEEIVFANSVSGAELMQQAQKQGLQVAGFAPQGGFTHGSPSHFGQPPGFAPPAGGALPAVPAQPSFAGGGSAASPFSNTYPNQAPNFDQRHPGVGGGLHQPPTNPFGSW